MTSSDPMVQPTRWVDDDSANQCPIIHRLIRDTSLACTLKPPVLHHDRTLWQTKSGVHIAVASATPVQNHAGYWHVRQDVPEFDWPFESRAPDLMEAQLDSCSTYDKRHPTAGQFIQALQNNRITTPEGITPLIRQLLGRDQVNNKPRQSPLVDFQFDQDRTIAYLTKIGKNRATEWQKAGATGQAIQKNTVAERIATGDLSYRDGIADLVGHSDEMTAIGDSLARQIDRVCDTWGGTSRASSQDQKTRISVPPPSLTALPSWMDPEKQLPLSHPLREWRRTMEASLAQFDPQWGLLDDQTRARRRFDWLQRHADAIMDAGGGEAFRAAMDEATGPFNALRYWLTGLTLPPSKPSLNDDKSKPSQENQSNQGTLNHCS